MCRLIETIKICNRSVCNIDYHNQRFNHARSRLFGRKDFIDLSDFIIVPDEVDNGIYKCRIVYSEKIETIEFMPYTIRNISSLKLITDNDIDYPHKYQNRGAIDELFLRRGCCDDILIVRNNRLSDTSYCNIALFDGYKWYTPEHPLLSGTKRQKLIDEKIVLCNDIKASDFRNYREVSVFNALIELGEIVVPTENIIL